MIYTNGLCQTSFLKPIMFADGNTNLFCKSKVVKTLFLKANIKFEKKFIMVSGKQTFFKQR